MCATTPSLKDRSRSRARHCRRWCTESATNSVRRSPPMATVSSSMVARPNWSPLRNRIEAVADGHGGVVTLIGAAGLGKSRLAEGSAGLGSSANRRHARRAIRRKQQLPGRPRSASLPSSVCPGRMSAVLGEQLRVIVTTTAPQLEPFLPLSGDALQLALPSTVESDSISAQFRADRTADVVLELIAGVHDEPLVFVGGGHAMGRRRVGSSARPDRIGRPGRIRGY